MTKYPDRLWLCIWLGGVGLLCCWDYAFLNKPAFALVLRSFFNTIVIAVGVVILTLILAWLTTIALNYLQSRNRRVSWFSLMFALNCVRSVPQIVGVLGGYVAIVSAIQNRMIIGTTPIFFCMALTMSIFIFIEVIDLMSERIAYYKQLDFYNAMRVCGISEQRIINFDILWKNSRNHIFNKLISVFAMAIFLQCSVDFIISVGLSTNISMVDLPPTLGNILAHIDSKQDILAIGYTLTNPLYAPNLLFKNLQGVTVSFLIVFTLICMHQISSGYSQRKRL
ncbi:MAG: ABC transporter permease [Chitinivibrionales bacterium]|nr:ABC transporter permease [Chitinivibrionales bacterium]